MRTLVTLVVVLAVLFAGCGEAVDRRADDSPVDDTGTVTPATVPDAPTAEDREAEIAPGISRTGVFDPERLTDAHAAVLANVSYTTRRVETRAYRNGSIRSRYATTVRVARGGDQFRYRLDQVVDGRDRRVDRWMADGRGVERVRDGDGDGVSYRRLTNPDAVLPERATNREGLVRILTVVDLEVTGRTTRDGTTLYRLGTAGTPGDLPPLRAVSVDAVIDERGLVRSYDLSYLVDRGGTTIRVTVDVTFRSIGSTTVSRPVWYGAAVDALESLEAATPTPTPAPVGIDLGTATTTAPPLDLALADDRSPVSPSISRAATRRGARSPPATPGRGR
jgi:hypothetical protein